MPCNFIKSCILKFPPRFLASSIKLIPPSCFTPAFSRSSFEAPTIDVAVTPSFLDTFLDVLSNSSSIFLALSSHSINLSGSSKYSSGGLFLAFSSWFLKYLAYPYISIWYKVKYIIGLPNKL